MNHFINGVARATIESFTLPGSVLEIGSYQVDGQAELAELRPLFPEQDYLGIDIRSGPGVDCVASVEHLPQATGSVGTVLALNTFEHVARFWRGFEEIHRVLRPDGALVVSCPFYFHIHNHPSDYWRFTPEALDSLLQEYPSRIIGWQGHRNKPLHVWAVAFREDYPAISAEQVDNYRRALSRLAKQPMPRLRKWRYQLGRLLCGRRPFVPYLDQEKWEIACHPPLLPADKSPTPNTNQTPQVLTKSM